MTHPKKLNKFNDRPIFNLDYTSFENNPEANTGDLCFKGSLYNVNTIEEFKSLNKHELLNEWGREIHDEITSQSDLSYGNLNKFYLLTYSDLKKYKFYYWFAFPILHSPWNVTGKNDALIEKYTKVIENKLNEVLFEQFFQIVDNEFVSLRSIKNAKTGVFVFIDTSLNQENKPSSQLANYLYFLATKGFQSIEIIAYRTDNSTFTLNLSLDSESFDLTSLPKITGWERSSKGKLGPKLADLGSLIDPQQLAEQAADLNLKLMKWRIAPQLDLDIIKDQRVLLLGAGTLGSYVSRTLLGWGVMNITLVDNGRISYSNPVRQPLYKFKDCFSENGRGELKAPKAAESLKEIFPGVNAKGYNMEVPMIGHPAGEEHKDNFDTLCKLFEENDVIFLLMDSRESRWLPTILGLAMDKIVLNAALGFDSYLVMRHGSLSQENRLGCYYCNDVVAPNDSLSDRTLDQMCTVTRPGVSLIASSLAVELLVSMLQHPQKNNAPVSSTKFGDVPHQIRGFVHNFSQNTLETPNYKHCSACSVPVIESFKKEGWSFIKKCLNNSRYLEDVCGLTVVQNEAELASEQIMNDFGLEDEDEDGEWFN